MKNVQAIAKRMAARLEQMRQGEVFTFRQLVDEDLLPDSAWWLADCLTFLTWEEARLLGWCLQPVEGRRNYGDLLDAPMRFYEKSAIAINPEEIVRIEFHEHGHFEGYETISFAENDQYVIATYEKGPCDRKTVKEYIGPARWLEIRNAIANADVATWCPGYFDPGICDGTQWYLTVELADGKSIEVHGSNAYPKEYEDVRKVLFPR